MNNLVNGPKVFIGITSYNHEEYIVPCLESILSQSYKNVYVVISDDKSKDKTVEVVEKFLKAHPEFPARLIKNDPNLGISKNVNQLISQISDEKYVSLFSGDDLMMPDRIEKLVSGLESNPGSSFAFSDMEWFLSSTGKKIMNHYGLINKPTVRMGDLLIENSIPSPTIMFRQSVMKGVLYDETLKYINDHMFIIELLSRGKALFVNEPLVRYRKHSTGASIVQTYYHDRIRLQEILLSRFGSTHPNVVNKYTKLVAYSTCLELQRTGRKLEAIKWFFKAFPAPFTSIKWLGRMAYMLRGFFKS